MRVAEAADIDKVAHVAAATFGLACPPTITPERVSAFITEVLSPERFADYLADPSRLVLVAEEAGRVVGYAMLVAGEPADGEVRAAIRHRPTVELSKIYVLPGSHGSGAARQLLEAGRGWAKDSGAAGLWLGVNQQNARAQRFYTKNGFQVVGTKRFNVGGAEEDDFVMEQPL
ncbi:GNAT family N-acetyltransferase [Intrasporangium chromatireducens]|uniref:GNAT family N-acetyltransferase n=1 Tax=Intrasporangium chromatireducens TaxID=1386088 RepID=UPI00146FC292|nr:GNAT family N-acetyltransferase [Intrasporangium chromatireducens]